MLTGVTNSVSTNHPGLTNQLLTSSIFLLHINFGFNEYPGLTNNCLVPERFVKSGDHCIEIRSKAPTDFSFVQIVFSGPRFCFPSKYTFKTKMDFSGYFLFPPAFCIMFCCSFS